ncbi:ABC transporter ATP-binding protein [Serratia proteamaculans]|uniref:ABC transporter ATP-binding protein n=1 Tax=Serratia proteamaculans TaxID=28151 RepID=UPI0010760929|nr:ABC transporter ATP-binding protein [Serratia proteamaculans]TFZ53212.1 ABC transporter ATP-binding protein [Serratia proteamaculans]
MPNLPTDSLLSVQNLSLTSPGKVPRINRVSFALQENESVTLIGPNGSGKSTLLRLITCELKPSEGEILFRGTPLSAIPPQQRARSIALLSQHDDADLRLRVNEYVALGRLPWQADKGPSEHLLIVEKAMDDVGIRHLQHLPLGNLSGGERQRAGFARVLAQQPVLLLLDEPTNHLDPLARHQLLSLIHQKKIATLKVLHDLELVQPFSDNVIMMNQGEIVCYGSPDTVLESTHLQQVFGMKSLQVRHPVTGQALRFFEALPTKAPPINGCLI